MIDQKTIDKAVRLLLDAVPSKSEVILFGSYARGDAHDDSDLEEQTQQCGVPGRS